MGQDHVAYDQLRFKKQLSYKSEWGKRLAQTHETKSMNTERV